MDISTFVHIASLTSNIPLMRTLLREHERKVNLEAKGNLGRTPLYQLVATSLRKSYSASHWNLKERTFEYLVSQDAAQDRHTVNSKVPFMCSNFQETSLEILGWILTLTGLQFLIRIWRLAKHDSRQLGYLTDCMKGTLDSGGRFPTRDTWTDISLYVVKTFFGFNASYHLAMP